ncbi:MAG TPA: hypothetical protein VHQ92_12595 [Pseudolabrys sp.]|jgi:hypothetical protein|nr:hypothetical protein [Pseudolabrys sp.]
MGQFTTTNVVSVGRGADGTYMGQSPTDPIQFFGSSTFVNQQTAPAVATDATTAIASANALRTALLNLGLIA